MKNKYKKLVIVTLLFLPIIIYLSSYLWQSRSSMYLFDGLLLNRDGVKIWAFGNLRQQMEYYADPASSQYQNEMKERRKYWPLIKIDQYLFKNYHVLEENRPILKGG